MLLPVIANSTQRTLFAVWDGMDPGYLQPSICCPELILFLCAIPFKVHDSSFWLSPGASSICAVQCGDPTTEPPYLQSEEPGGEGSAKEDAGQKAQAYLLSQALLPPHK